MDRVLILGSLYDSLLSGAIPALGIVLGGAVVNLIRKSREARKNQGAATSAETAHLEEPP